MLMAVTQRSAICTELLSSMFSHKSSTVPAAQFNHALETVQAHGPLPHDYKVEFEPSPGNGWRFLSKRGSSDHHPLKDLSPSSPVMGLSEGPPRQEGLVPCVGRPPKYLPGSYKWRRCESAFEAVWESLVASGAVDPNIKSTFNDSFITMENQKPTLELYHPHDRNSAPQFASEEAAARLCRHWSRNLFLVTFKLPILNHLNMGWCLENSKDRLHAESRWSVGEQEDMPCVPIGCLPEVQMGRLDTANIKGIWYVLQPISPKTQELHSIWRTE